jgi:hypothetical protein
MNANRLPGNDPRTIARDIPGILESLFPQLVPGLVAHFNRKAAPTPDCQAVAPEVIQASHLQRAMLFEIAIAAAEQLLAGGDEIDWGMCLSVATLRQRRHFDAQAPDDLLTADKTAALTVAENLVSMLRQYAAKHKAPIVRSPAIPGYQWISSSVGDFSAGARLIEVKCTNKHFSSADYRQMLIYWLLSYAQSVEISSPEWSDAVLMNPRLNLTMELPFTEIITIASGGKSKVDVLELFAAMVGERKGRSLAMD